MRSFDGNLQESGSKHKINTTTKDPLPLRSDQTLQVFVQLLVWSGVKKGLWSPAWGAKVLLLWPPPQQVLQDVQPCVFQLEFHTVTNSMKYFSATFWSLNLEKQEQLRSETFLFANVYLFYLHELEKIAIWTCALAKMLFWEPFTILTHSLSKQCPALLFSHPVHFNSTCAPRKNVPLTPILHALPFFLASHTWPLQSLLILNLKETWSLLLQMWLKWGKRKAEGIKEGNGNKETSAVPDLFLLYPFISISYPAPSRLLPLNAPEGTS